MASLQRTGVEAAMALPESQRGAQNRESKTWVLINPDGNRVCVRNLLDWARGHYDLFEPDCPDPEKAAKRIANGFQAVAGSMRGVPSRSRPVSSYKGWGLAELPNK